MALVKINGFEIDKFIQKDTYTMEQQDVFDSWTDANLKTHRSVYRTKITGSFEIGFIRSDEHDEILNLLQTATEEGITTMTVYVQNINDEVEVKGYYKLTPKSFRKFSQGYQRDLMGFEFEEM